MNIIAKEPNCQSDSQETWSKVESWGEVLETTGYTREREGESPNHSHNNTNWSLFLIKVRRSYVILLSYIISLYFLISLYNSGLFFIYHTMIILASAEIFVACSSARMIVSMPLCIGFTLFNLSTGNVCCSQKIIAT